jgi:hypothetical protein
MSELSVYELDAQHGELLPVRETLSFFSIGNTIQAIQTNAAANVAVLSAGVTQANFQANVANIS